MIENKKLKALLLVGGFGTRLRPLTFSKAKPLIEFINKPILVHQIEALKKVDVDEIILAINYQPEKMIGFLNEIEKNFNIKLTISKEDIPLGTGGPIGLAKKYLEKTEGDEIFIFNSDVTCSFPLQEMLDFHRKHGKEGTIAVTKVKDPSRFGVIVSDSNKKILKFVEKPKEFIGDNINAGLYIFNKKVLNRFEPKPTSIEREIFPKMASEGELYIFDLNCFWADIGKPTDYLIGTNLYLEHLNKISPNELSKGIEGQYNVIGNVVIHPSAKIENDCVIGPNVVIGKNVVIKKGVKIENSVILDGSIINDYAFIDSSIIGWNCKVGKWVKFIGLSILGEDVNVKDTVLINKSIILPNLTIKENTKEGSIILC